MTLASKGRRLVSEQCSSKNISQSSRDLTETLYQNLPRGTGKGRENRTVGVNQAPPKNKSHMLRSPRNTIHAQDHNCAQRHSMEQRTSDGSILEQDVDVFPAFRATRKLITIFTRQG